MSVPNSARVGNDQNRCLVELLDRAECARAVGCRERHVVEADREVENHPRLEAQHALVVQHESRLSTRTRTPPKHRRQHPCGRGAEERRGRVDGDVVVSLQLCASPQRPCSLMRMVCLTRAVAVPFPPPRLRGAISSARASQPRHSRATRTDIAGHTHTLTIEGITTPLIRPVAFQWFRRPTKLALLVTSQSEPPRSGAHCHLYERHLAVVDADAETERVGQQRDEVGVAAVPEVRVRRPHHLGRERSEGRLWRDQKWQGGVCRRAAI